jgi:hypothetical protein
MKRLLRSYVYNGFVWELNCSTSGELNDDKSSIITHSNNIAVSIKLVQSNYEPHTIHGGLFGLSLYCINSLW